MTGVGFEPTNPVFDWDKTVHALDRAATVVDILSVYGYEYYSPAKFITA
jgi:hypothetical protein